MNTATRLALVLFAASGPFLLSEAEGQEIDLSIHFKMPEIDFRPLQSPVKNQGHRGTCTAFALTAALETFPGMPHDLSEQFIYGLAKNEQLPIYAKLTLKPPDLDDPLYEGLRSDGLNFADYAVVLKRFGVTYEELLPYNRDRVEESQALRRVLPKNEAAGVEKLLYDRTQMTDELRLQLIRLAKFRIKNLEIIDFSEVRSRSPGGMQTKIDALRSWLASGKLGRQAIPIGFHIHPQVWGYQYQDRAPVITVEPMARALRAEKAAADRARRAGKKPPPSLVGGHAVTIAGYTEDIRRYVPSVPEKDAKKAYWIIKNSWGPHWGNLGGYGFVSLDYHRQFALEAMLIEGASVKPAAFRIGPLGLLPKIKKSVEHKLPFTGQAGDP